MNIFSRLTRRIYNIIMPDDKPDIPPFDASNNPSHPHLLPPTSTAPSTLHGNPSSPQTTTTTPTLLPNPPNLNESYWAHVTDSFLISHDKQTWAISVVFVVFIMSELGPELAFSVCMGQMVLQRYLIYYQPDLYRQHRDKVCALVRAWRVFMVYHLSSRGYSGTLSTQSQWPAVVVARQVLVGTGSLINLVVAVGYQLRFSSHLLFQLTALAASIVGGTANVVRVLEAHPATVAAVEMTRDKFSDLGSMLFEGVPSTSSPTSICRPPAALSVTLLVQIYIGFLLPSYVLYIFESSTKRRFLAETLGLDGTPPPPPSNPEAPRREPHLHRLAGFLLHAFSLLVLLCTCWEVVSFALCIYPRLGRGARAAAV